MITGFDLRISTTNAAFRDQGAEADDDMSHEIACQIELARILHGVAEAVHNGRSSGRCMDSNGNVVGRWTLC